MEEEKTLYRGGGNNEQDSRKDLERRKTINVQSFVHAPEPLMTETSFDQAENDQTNRSSYYSGNPHNFHPHLMSHFKEFEQSISSMQVTNYEDSEFMISAYKKKKQACDKYKKQQLKLEQENHILG
jgi:hypothetical protein